MTVNDNMMERLGRIGIIPVLVLNHAEDAEPVGRILFEEGLPAAEVTFRTDAAEEAISILRATIPEMLVGAGTVLNEQQARKAVDAGAQFIVSPGADKETIMYCINNEIPVCPGTQTPSEIMMCVNLGLHYVKFFPAELSGGLKMINSITSALTTVRVMPTGGINAGNAGEYLRNEKVFCVGGTWIANSVNVENHQWDIIRGNAKEASNIVRTVQKENQTTA